MLLTSKDIADRISDGQHQADPLKVVPTPDLEWMVKNGSASLDIRLGRWFSTLRYQKMNILDLDSEREDKPEAALAKRHFTPFGDKFVLHPGNFVLGSTLEWIRMPANLGGYITGRSSWGRRGLIIETASGIHPGFCGCITLEIANVGQIPIAIRPGMPIAQIFFHMTFPSEGKSQSNLSGRRRPMVGQIRPDAVADRLFSVPNKEGG